jgi:hypothetical protein
MIQRLQIVFGNLKNMFVIDHLGAHKLCAMKGASRTTKHVLEADWFSQKTKRHAIMIIDEEKYLEWRLWEFLPPLF